MRWIFLLCLLMPWTLEAASISIPPTTPPSSGLGIRVASAGGGPLLTGGGAYYITVGTFLVLPFYDFSEESAQVFLEQFVPLQRTLGAGPATSPSPASGNMTGSFSGNGPESLSGMPIYILLTDVFDYTRASEMAVLSAPGRFFPSSVSLTGSVVIPSSFSNFQPLVGEFTAASPSYVTMVTTGIPEPGVVGMSLIAMFGLLNRRRLS